MYTISLVICKPYPPCKTFSRTTPMGALRAPGVGAHCKRGGPRRRTPARPPNTPAPTRHAAAHPPRHPAPSFATARLCAPDLPNARTRPPAPLPTKRGSPLLLVGAAPQTRASSTDASVGCALLESVPPRRVHAATGVEHPKAGTRPLPGRGCALGKRPGPRPPPEARPPSHTQPVPHPAPPYGHAASAREAFPPPPARTVTHCRVHRVRAFHPRRVCALSRPRSPHAPHGRRPAPEHH